MSEKENVDEDILLLGHGPTAVEVDIMQPLDPEKSPKVGSLCFVLRCVEPLRLLALYTLCGCLYGVPFGDPRARSAICPTRLG